MRMHNAPSGSWKEGEQGHANSQLILNVLDVIRLPQASS